VHQIERVINMLYNVPGDSAITAEAENTSKDELFNNIGYRQEHYICWVFSSHGRYSIKVFFTPRNTAQSQLKTNIRTSMMCSIEWWHEVTQGDLVAVQRMKE